MNTALEQKYVDLWVTLSYPENNRTISLDDISKCRIIYFIVVDLIYLAFLVFYLLGKDGRQAEGVGEGVVWGVRI